MYEKGDGVAIDGADAIPSLGTGGQAPKARQVVAMHDNNKVPRSFS